MGFIAGVVVGLAVALAVAIYVTKVPVPLLHDSPSRTADQDAKESKRNKDWDPNAPLYGKNPAKAASGVAGPVAATSATATTPSPAPAASRPAAPASAKGVAAATDPNIYFVQAGAFNVAQDADAQRAKLSLAGIEAVVSEREQSGGVLFRVRVGPYQTREDAETAMARIKAAGFDVGLVPVKR